jgi:hypothetical protein
MYSEVIPMAERYLLTMVQRSTAEINGAGALGITRGSLRSKIRGLGISLGASVTVDGVADAPAEDGQVVESSA